MLYKIIVIFVLSEDARDDEKLSSALVIQII